MLKLSIIIPVYNVEIYIHRCLESCIEQDLSIEEYEIVVVDDGSPDKSIQKVNEIMAEQQAKEGTSNIKIITRENGGLSAARNTGLKEAKGEYVWFVDSDDWIEPNVLHFLVNKAHSEDLDILCFNFQLVYPNGKTEIYKTENKYNDIIYKGEDFVCKVNILPVAWSAIYRRSFLLKNNLSFYEGILHEDQEFTPRAYYLAKRITHVAHLVYNYNQREGSIMKGKNKEKRCKSLLKVADSLYNFTKNNIPQKTEAFNCFQNKIAFAFTQSLSLYEPHYFCIKEYKLKVYYPLSIKISYGLKAVVKYQIANSSLHLYLIIRNLLK